MRNAYKMLIGKLVAKRPFGRPRIRGEVNTKNGFLNSSV
jgi:hypothetical protein